jgi:hypothetical protein
MTGQPLQKHGAVNECFKHLKVLEINTLDTLGNIHNLSIIA